MQLFFDLIRKFYIKSFYELATIFEILNNCIVKIMKLLYKILETKNYWYAIYHQYHLKKLNITKSTYDSCFFHNYKFFVVIDFQIEVIFILTSDNFAIVKNEIIKIAKFITKKQNCFIIFSSIKFNEIMINFFENKNIIMKQLFRSNEILLINNQHVSFVSFENVIKKNLTSKNQYIIQRTRNVYVTSMCQFEIFFDFSYAVQLIKYISNDII